MLREVPQTFPVARKYLGYLLLLSATFLILGGAYRIQSNMISSGLLFLSFGTIISRPNLRNTMTQWGLGSLVLIGAVYTFLT